jgi:antitoxin YefM
MKLVNYTDLRLNLKKHLDCVVNDVEEVIIKRSGNDDVVLVPLEEYMALKETCYLMTGKNRDVLLKSIEEMKDGKIVHHKIIED